MTQIIYILISWIIGSLLVRLSLLAFKLDDLFPNKIYLKKPDKFLTKVDPIYELFQVEIDGDYYIKKYSLGYKLDNTISGFLFFFIPVPIYFYRYRYIDNRWAFFACSKDYILSFDSDIKTVYETKLLDDAETEIRTKKYEDEILNKISEINAIYTENYEN